jgi:hypothetical protein
VVDSEAERRGKLNAEEPGEMIFKTRFEYIEAIQVRVRRAMSKSGGEEKLKRKDIAEQGEMSPSTVGNMASGKTLHPRFETMFGLADALDQEVIFRPRKRAK